MIPKGTVVSEHFLGLDNLMYTSYTGLLINQQHQH